MDISLYDNFVFDLYGTLIDTSTDEHSPETWETWSSWLDGRGYRHDEPMKMHETFFAADEAARVKARAEWGFTYPEIDVVPIYRDMMLAYGNPLTMIDDVQLSVMGYAFRTASRKYMRLFPGVSDFLEKLREEGKKVYILSNAQRCYTWPEICFFGLTRMTDGIMISSDERCMKPDRAIYDSMASAYGLDPNITIMIGDNEKSDYEGALNAGWHALLLTGENSPDNFYREHN